MPLAELADDALDLAVLVQFAQAGDAAAVDAHVGRDHIVEHEVVSDHRAARVGLAVEEQVALGQIEARKIFGKLNNADLHTKPLRSSSFPHMAHKILGQPAPILPLSTPLVDEITDPLTEIVPLDGMDVTGQPISETKRPAR